MGNFDCEPRFKQQVLVLIANLHNKDQTIRSWHSVSRYVHQSTRRLSLSLFKAVKLQGLTKVLAPDRVDQPISPVLIAPLS
jgi:hypothetical protein